jgi:hypothetical protein
VRDENAPTTSTTTTISSPRYVVTAFSERMANIHSLVPITALGIHIFLAIFLTFLVTRACYRSYLALPPSQGTRTRGIVRRDHVKIFAALAAVSLGLAGYWAYTFAHLSYRVWADERGVELPERYAYRLTFYSIQTLK